MFFGNELAGYAANLVYDGSNTEYITMKFDPKLLKAYSSYAMHFKMNEYYLQERGGSWVVNGWRNIGHDTDIQALLIHRFGFLRMPTNLYVTYRPWLATALSLPPWAKQWLGKRVHQYASLCRLDEARTHSAKTTSE